MRRARGQDAAAGKPAARCYDHRLTDLDRAMVARRDAGATRTTVAAEFGVTVEVVRRAEWRSRRDAHGRKLLAADPENLEGLGDVGELRWGVSSDLRCHHYHYDGPQFERLSEVAAAGRSYVAGIEGFGPKRMAELDVLLERHGMTWSPNARQLKRRPEQTSEPAPAPRYSQEEIVAVIFRLQARLSYLEGYVSERRRLRGQDLDSEPEPATSAPERAGNVVCLPGVSLASIRSEEGDDPGPTAA